MTALTAAVKLAIKGDSKGGVKALRDLEKQTQSSGRGFSSWGKTAKAAAKLATVGIGLAVGSLYVLKRATKAVINEATEQLGLLVKLKRQTNGTTAETSLLAGQLRLSGVNMNTVSKSLVLFNKNLYSARTGTAKVMADISELDKTSENYDEKLAKLSESLATNGGAFTALGINIRDTDGKYRTASDLLSEVRSRVSQLEDPTKRTALVMQLFGKSGAELLPWLTKGQDEIDGYTQQIKKLGIFTEADMEIFSEFRANQRLMSYFFDMVKVKAGLFAMKLINKVFPVLEDLYAKYSPKVKEALRTIGEWLARNGDEIRKMFSGIGKLAGTAAKHIDLVVAAIGVLLALKLTNNIALMFSNISGAAVGAAGSVAGFSIVLRLVPWAAALAGAIALGDYLGGKFQEVIDGFDRKMGMTNDEIEYQHKLMKSRFGGKAAEEFDKVKKGADSAKSGIKATGSELTKIGKMHPKPTIDVDKESARTAAREARQEMVEILAKKIAAQIKATVTIGIGGGTGAGLGDSFSSALGGIRAAQFAKAQIGDSYRVGATGPDVWDCSGLAMGAYRAAGLSNFPTYTGNQWVLGRQIPKSQVRAGDQIFMKTGIPQWTDAFGWGHTGVAVSSTMMVHASGSRTGVIMSPIGAGYPWAARRQLAKGGYVKARPGGVPALLGEAGGDELVVSNLRKTSTSAGGDVYVEVNTGDVYAGSEDEAASSIDYITHEVTKRLVPAIRATRKATA